MPKETPTPPKLPPNVTVKEIRQAVREIVLEKRHKFAQEGIGAHSQAFADHVAPILIKGAETIQKIEKAKLKAGDYAPPSGGKPTEIGG
ncbi:hypothetical protein COW80_01155 [Candidatus Beckwithbacteria bacterium CG22_combo_CG10-13_8_21_14_all_01_47_9]|uniref:Uncharacterized protein n=2 Tax=Candidatus Beckwithiibacteriota TaxID=1752726 RepID=A0A2H0E1L5_9BACT|nr:MAG: hypothetical protein COW80_01155 [Candidatus Beckwithbacteria bacterium CG22_combo_CG10-13_8_21_14_all_01_47_9]PJC66803.1 MAG: hypothetical protein CO018_00055 [Candidatus Beckwithbacteria bacterium CG_4_9_14_0_2_um_filter_47_11]